MRPYVSACVATLESVTLLLFVFTNTSSGFVRHFSVAGARNALHGWCAWCRGPLSSRTSSTFCSRCASIREPTHHRTHRTHLYLPGAISSPIDATLGHWPGLSSILPFLLFLPSFSPRRTSWRHFEVPSSPSSRRTARTTGSSSSRCSCARRSSCTATTSRLGTFLL